MHGIEQRCSGIVFICQLLATETEQTGFSVNKKFVVPLNIGSLCGVIKGGIGGWGGALVSIPSKAVTCGRSIAFREHARHW